MEERLRRLLPPIVNVQSSGDQVHQYGSFINLRFVIFFFFIIGTGNLKKNKGFQKNKIQSIITTKGEFARQM